MAGTSKVQVEVIAILRDLFSRPSDQVVDSLKQINRTSESTARSSSGLSRALDSAARAMGRGVANVGRYNVGLGALKATVTGLIAAFGVSAISRYILSDIEALDELESAAKKTGITVEQLSRVRLVGEDLGVDTGVLTKGLSELQKRLSSVASPQGKKAFASLQELGISKETVDNTKDFTKLLPLIADGLQGLGTGDQIRILADLFGKGRGVEILPFFEAGADAIAKSLERIDKLGLGFTASQTKGAKELNDAIVSVARSWQGVKAEFIKAVGPSATKFLEAFAERVSKLKPVASGIFDYLTVSVNADSLAEPRRSDALKAANEFSGAVSDGFITIITEAGKLFVTIIVSGIQIGIAKAGPLLRDTLTDGFVPLINGALGTKFEKSLSGQLSDAKQQAKDVELERVKLRDEIAAMERGLESQRAKNQSNFRPRPEFGGLGDVLDPFSRQPGVSAERRLEDARKRLAEINKILAESPKRVTELSAKVLDEQIANQEQFGQVVSDTLDDLNRAKDSSLAAIDKSIGRVTAATQAIAGLKQEVTKVGTAAEVAYKELTLEQSAILFAKSVRSAVATGKQYFKEFADDASEALDKTFKKAAALADRVSASIGLVARRYAALGGEENKRLAERLQQQLQFAREQADFSKTYGKDAGPLLQQLSEVQDIERRGLVIRQQVNAATEEASRIETNYQANLAEREALQKAGQLTGTEVAKANSEEAKAARERLITIRDGLKQLAAESPEFARQIEEALKRINSSIRQLTQPDQGDFVGGLKAGFQNFVDDAARIYDRAKQLGGDLANAGASSVSGFFIALKDGSQSAGEAFNEFYTGLISRIADLIIQFTVLQLVASALGGLGLFGGAAAAAGGGGGGGVASVLPYAGRAGLNKGGRVPGFASGGRIPGGGPDVDSTLIAATPQEFMIRRQSANYYGDVILDALNQMLIPRDILERVADLRSSRHLPTMNVPRPPRGGYQGLNSGGRVAPSGSAGAQTAVIVSSERMAEELTQGKSRATLEKLVRDVLGRR